MCNLAPNVKVSLLVLQIFIRKLWNKKLLQFDALVKYKCLYLKWQIRHVHRYKLQQATAAFLSQPQRFLGMQISL